MRWFLVYAVVELAAVVALAWAIGLGWTILLLLVALVIGIALAGSQVKRQVGRLRGGLDTPQGALTDSALIAVGTLLVVVPGIVTTALGLLLLLPPAHAAARPIFAMLAARRMRLVVPRREYIDAEVVVPREREVPPVVDVEPPALPR